MFLDLHKIREKQQIKKLNNILLLIILPILILTICIFIFSAPQNFTLYGGFSLTPIDATNDICSIYCSGYELVQPGKIKLNGQYPWIYGIYNKGFKGEGETEYFTLDLKSGEIVFYPLQRQQDFTFFLEQNELPADVFFSYSELFPQNGNSGNVRARKKLKERLSKPVKTLSKGFF